MTDFLSAALALVVALGILIAVHEFGHFWVARTLGVKVLRFSIGFGRPLWTRRAGADQTEYVLAAIPLGGYVKMLDEREGEVAPEELPRAFNRQPVAKRFAIVAAGPLFNFVFAVIAYWFMFVNGIPGMTPIIGEVEAGSPAAQAGLRSGQTILAVNDRETPTWGAVFDTLLPPLLTGQSLDFSVQRDGGRFDTRLPAIAVAPDIQPDELIALIGMEPYRPPIAPVIGEVVAGSPAAQAGLQPGDHIAAIDGAPINEWRELVESVRQSPGTPLVLTVRRDGATRAVEVRPRRVETDTGAVGQIGAQVSIDPAQFQAYEAEWRHGPWKAAGSSLAKTWEMASLTLQMLGKMVVGEASVENISGPITIARYAKESAFAGVSRFLSFLAIVSISLGVLNLLPVPVLDGGHLMYYVVEAVKGSPVSEQTEAIGQRIGIAMILALMALAFYNDLVRLAG
jgi:regulator of sigma E protease